MRLPEPRLFSAACKTASLIAVAALCVQARILFVPTIDYATISKAMITAKAGDTIKVDPGTYREHVLLQAGVTLVSTRPLKARIHGGHQGYGIVMAKNSSIRGFDIRRCIVGVVSHGSGVSITGCRVVYNRHSGIQCVNNLPRMEDNIIAFNGASGVYLRDIGPAPKPINHCTIAFNARHGLCAAGASQVQIINSIVAFNERGGLALRNASTMSNVLNNCIYGNPRTAMPKNAGIVAADPLFVAPRSALDFSLQKGSPAHDAGTDRRDLGIRSGNGSDVSSPDAQ